MKKILLIAGLCCAFSFAQAQSSTDQTQPSSTTDQSTTTTTTKHHHHAKPDSDSGMKGGKTLTGCVSGPNDEGKFMLKTMMHRNVELETTEDLKAHVGHEVKVTGSWDKSADTQEKEAAKSDTDKDKKAEAKERHFKADSIAMVSDTCKMGTKGKTKTEKMEDKSSNPQH